MDPKTGKSSKIPNIANKLPEDLRLKIANFFRQMELLAFHQDILNNFDSYLNCVFTKASIEDNIVAKNEWMQSQLEYELQFLWSYRLKTQIMIKLKSIYLSLEARIFLKILKRKYTLERSPKQMLSNVFKDVKN